MKKGTGIFWSMLKQKIEGEDVAFEHALEEPECALAVAQDEVVLLAGVVEDGEAELLVEGLGNMNVLHRQADRERS